MAGYAVIPSKIFKFPNNAKRDNLLYLLKIKGGDYYVSILFIDKQ